MKKILSFPFVRETGICAIVAPILGLIGFLDLAGLTPMAAGLLLWMAFGGLGVVHIRYFRRRLLRLGMGRLLFAPFGWTATLAPAGAILLLLLLLFNSSRPSLACVGCSAFLLPYVIAEAWENFYSIPEREYKVWHNPETMDQFTVKQTRHLPVRLKVRRRYADLHEELFPLTAPARWKVGRFFYHFIQDEESKGAPAFEKEDETRKPYGWQFYSADYGGFVRRFLDPQRTLEENNVRENTVIVARRVRTTGLPSKQILKTV
jgi:hypothetical protein